MEAPDTPTLGEDLKLQLPLHVTPPAIDYLPYWKEATARQRLRIALYNAAIYLPVVVKLSLILSIYPIYIVFYLYPKAFDVSAKPELYFWHTSSERRESKVEAGLLFAALTFFMAMYSISFYKAARTSPGAVPDADDWKLSKSRHPGDSPNAQFMIERKQTTGEVRTCSRCAKLKPDRSHHCRLCDTCVLKMDHHCPWIANCVGFYNYKYFFLMLTYGMLGLWLFEGTFWETALITWRDDERGTAFSFFVTVVFALMFILMAAVTLFWSFHVYLIVSAVTTIEYCEKHRKNPASSRGSPYYRSVYESLQDALGKEPVYWLLPFRYRSCDENGLFFNVVPTTTSSSSEPEANHLMP